MNPGEPLIRWEWVLDHLDDITGYLVQHIVLTGIALTVGFAISFGLSLLIYRHRGFYRPVIAVTGIIFTIPSLALFMLLVPFTGLSVVTAEVALIGYTLLIFIRNIVAGLDGVAPDVREAATGMGYTPWRRLFAIELPLALPVIIAGVRVATVTTIGLVTVTAMIGLGGVGQLILTGLLRPGFFLTPLYVGGILSVALALIADVALIGVQRALTPWTRRAASTLPSSAPVAVGGS